MKITKQQKQTIQVALNVIETALEQIKSVLPDQSMTSSEIFAIYMSVRKLRDQLDVEPRLLELAGKHMNTILQECLHLRRKISLTDKERDLLHAKNMELISAMNHVVSLGGNPNDYVENNS